ncbi:hypothetical protein R4172_14510 [Rhodococcus kroppenstedtii]|uniref:Sensory transduction regulator n=1 Tax=Rhodococcoides kroppenstedtii TaxID=293050 RepID=A0A1I0SI20_9NOCA|nr:MULTISPECIES: hypothetical protein [Rhodococcus]AMY18470.1 hypothetical protein A3Q40_01074 [Rhodococcus sp. PBTS 1]MBY6312430.1 hypothetical protein [Rhodococcus kroppenstedtii]MBY6320258.1 hypothetical protein [Rhodococcus kroppenstedtii]MBY6398721.1 hypothetical protein [Rhodococcus kroppenstedtii]MBY6436807.1 hypothetical protein [Rhodococcus kroppenstedtii]
MTEHDVVAALQDRTRVILGQFADVTVADDGSLGFTYAGALCSLRAVALGPGLEVLALTSVLAWDRPSSGGLRAKVAARNAESQFGSISVVGHGSQADVILRYTFPATGLDDEPLMTMLVLVLSGVEKARVGLVP